tara:strand:+ start:27343 stop:27774 length:432 start_codon:yes stop_codon:yes gene_type:complete
VDVLSEPWCRQSCCEINVDKYIEEHGGDKIIGYKVWYLRNKFIEAERHVIYKSGDSYRDLTFNTDGEEIILFVPDSNPSQGYDDRPLKIRKGITQKARYLVKAMELQDASTVQMSNEESWNTMPTYEDWLKGKRVPNLIPTIG